MVGEGYRDVGLVGEGSRDVGLMWRMRAGVWEMPPGGWGVDGPEGCVGREGEARLSGLRAT